MRDTKLKDFIASQCTVFDVSLTLKRVLCLVSI